MYEAVILYHIFSLIVFYETYMQHKIINRMGLFAVIQLIVITTIGTLT